MKAHAVITCPLWEDPDGTRRPGFTYEPSPPPVVGWVNVMNLTIDGERYLVLLTTAAACPRT